MRIEENIASNHHGLIPTPLFMVIRLKVLGGESDNGMSTLPDGYTK